MSSNWNVYKLFKSGKRAKAPIHTFSYEGDLGEASTQFERQSICKQPAHLRDGQPTRGEFRMSSSEKAWSVFK